MAAGPIGIALGPAQPAAFFPNLFRWAYSAAVLMVSTVSTSKT